MTNHPAADVAICEVKIKFDSVPAALDELAAIKKRNGFVGSHYRCPVCGGFHITGRRPKRMSASNNSRGKKNKSFRDRNRKRRVRF